MTKKKDAIWDLDVKDFCKITGEKIEVKNKAAEDQVQSLTINPNTFMKTTRHEFYQALIIKKNHSLQF